MTRDDLFAKGRRLLGVTDETKGGPTNAELLPDLNNAIEGFVAEAGALKSNFKLSTQANDKYLPLIDEILWPITVSFVDADGRAYQLDQVLVAPRPGSLGGRPNVWWETAVNVPDITGPSTPSLAIDPYVNYTGVGNVLVEAIQLQQPLVSAGDIPELKTCLHRYLAFAFALEILPLFPDKLNLEGYLERHRARGIDLFKSLARAEAHSVGGRDVKGYGRRARARF